MIVTGLKLTNLRCHQGGPVALPAKGFNLIVGVNGVGKTSVLDALSGCLSAVVKKSEQAVRSQAKRFLSDDIRIGTNALTMECDLSFNWAYKNTATLSTRPGREQVAPQKRKGGTATRTGTQHCRKWRSSSAIHRFPYLARRL